MVPRPLNDILDLRVPVLAGDGGPSDGGHDDGGHGGGVGVVTKTVTRTKTPSMYKVLLLNDDYTPMEYVIEVLKKYFRKDHQSATELMLKVHHQGYAVCGVYPYELAETKVALVIEDARQHGYPLQCTLEKA